jgi:hypothetical protein
MFLIIYTAVKCNPQKYVWGTEFQIKNCLIKKIRNIVLVDNQLELSPFHEDIFFIEQIYKMTNLIPLSI